MMVVMMVVMMMVVVMVTVPAMMMVMMVMMVVANELELRGLFHLTFRLGGLYRPQYSDGVGNRLEQLCIGASRSETGCVRRNGWGRLSAVEHRKTRNTADQSNNRFVHEGLL